MTDYRYDYVWGGGYMKKWERDIQNLCNAFGKELSDRKQKMSQEITKWRDDLVRQINDHARQQTNFLGEEYQKQRRCIDDMRQQFTDATRRYENSGNNVQIDELIGQCRALKFELGALEYPMESTPFIKFMTEEQLERKKPSEKMVGRTDDKQSRSSSGGGYDNYNLNDTGAQVVVPSKEAFVISSQGNRQTTTTKSTNGNAVLSNSSDNRRSNANSDNMCISECPVCAMSFPSHMTRPEQATHVNAHFQVS